MLNSANSHFCERTSKNINYFQIHDVTVTCQNSKNYCEFRKLHWKLEIIIRIFLILKDLENNNNKLLKASEDTL